MKASAYGLTVLVVVLATNTAACGLSQADYRTIDAWLLCDECPDSLRAAVKALGGKAVHTLDGALVGPSAGRLANKKAQFQQVYATLPAPAVSESAYVADLLSNYVATYQARAALSLGDIRTSAALAALQRASDSAAARNYRDDVVRTVKAVLALASAAADPAYAFAGVVHPTSAGFADTVRVSPGQGLSWNGDEGVILNGSPFADSVMVTRWGADSLAFVAAGILGDYGVSVTRLGPDAVTQAFPLAIGPSGYTSHSPGTAPSVAGDSFPQTRYLLLPSRPGDSSDFFRFEPSTTRTYTATVTVSGLTPATLRWYNCPGVTMLTPPGPFVTLAGSVVDDRGRPVDGAVVTVVGLSGSVVTDVGGRFVRTNIPAAAAARLRAAKLDFRPSETSIQLAADTIGLGVVRSPLTEATAVNRQSSTLTIHGGSCRYLQVLVPFAGGPRVIRLRLTTP